MAGTERHSAREDRKTEREREREEGKTCQDAAFSVCECLCLKETDLS